MLTRPEQATEGFRRFFQTRATAGFNHGNELLVNLVEHGLRECTLLFALRTERIEKTLVLASRQQPAFHTQLFHQAGETKTIHQHANAAHNAGLVDIDLVGCHCNVVSG